VKVKALTRAENKIFPTFTTEECKVFEQLGFLDVKTDISQKSQFR
jgi:hypothetical protein